MAFQAWVCTGDGDPVVEPAAGPGAGWQKVGELDSDARADMVRAVQHRLGYDSSSPPKSVKATCPATLVRGGAAARRRTR